MKPVELDDFIVDSAADDQGYGWYVWLQIKNNGNCYTWCEPREARKLARLLLRAAQTPPRKKARKGKRK